MNSSESYEIPDCINHKNEVLPLNLIIVEKKITSVTIKYLTKEIRVKANLFKGRITSKVTEPEIKELTITENEGLKMDLDLENERVILRTNSFEDFQKLKDGEFEEDTITKLYKMSYSHPFYFFFNVANLSKVDWN